MHRALVLALASGCHASSPHPAEPITFDGEPELVERGTISSTYSEIRLATSPDGTVRLWGSTDRPGGPGGWDIWMSRLDGDAWTPPAPVPFDSEANDFDPAFSPDGAFVYFFSNRPGGAGGDDIYRAPITPDGFGDAQHLGPEINTPGDEWAPAPALDGSGLLFASNRPPGKHDLYFAVTAGDGFAQAAPLPGTLNTPNADEFDAAYLANGSSLVFARSTNVESDPIELYLARRGPNGYDAGTRLAAIDVAGGYTLGPAIDLHDRSTLYISSVRASAKVGKLDIYKVRYHLPAATAALR